jgi:tetratricopeptide (TPR) repeat protein
MIKSTFFIFILLLITVTVKAEEADSLLLKANKYYQKQNFSEAIVIYKQILDKGYRTGEVYYNLGNAYFRMNQIPRAILMFERAKKISPEDDDVEFNLKIANLKIVDKIEPIPKFFITQWLESLESSFSSATWSVIFVFFIWLLFICIAVFYISWNSLIKRITFGIGVISIIIIISSIIFAFSMSQYEESNNTAIIFTPNVYVKSSPDEGSTDLFILHEGTKVEIMDELGSWKKIKLANGSIGWLPDNSIEII